MEYNDLIVFIGKVIGDYRTENSTLDVDICSTKHQTMATLSICSHPIDGHFWTMLSTSLLG